MAVRKHHRKISIDYITYQQYTKNERKKYTIPLKKGGRGFLQQTIEKIELKHDVLIDITEFKAVTATKEPHNKKLTYGEFVRSLQKPKITNEKGSNGGFVGGWVEGERTNGNVKTRSLITLDIDDEQENDVWSNVENYSNFAAVMYSTHNSVPGKPRYRLIIPLSSPVEPDKYEPIARFIVEMLHLNIDKSSYTLSQHMHYPTCENEDEYQFFFRDSPLFNPDDVPVNIMKQYQEISNFTSGKFEKRDPRTKQNWIGAWCSIYSITDVLNNFLSDVYEPFNNDRYSYIEGSTEGGAVVYDNDTHLHSNHSTDQISEMNVNSFDLYRLHKYGHLDEGTEDMKDKPSYKAMVELCKRDEAVRSYYEDNISFKIHVKDGEESIEVDPSQFFDDKDKFQHHKFACYLVKEWNIIKLDDRLHIYNQGAYVADDIYIKRLMVSIITSLKINQIKEVMERLKLVAPIREHSEPRYINVKNGVYDLAENKLLDHDPDFVITNQLNACYGPNAQSEEVENMFQLIGNGDGEIIQLLKEMTGYTLYRANIFEKIFLLLGGGGNGKSTLLNAIAILHGEENVQALSIQQIGDKFNTGLLQGKTINIGDDIPFTSIKDTSVLKKLATGQRVNAEFKGVDGFSFENFAKLMFTTNKIPRFYDNSQGFNDRFIIVPLRAQIRNTGKQDNNFTEKLKKEEAKSSLLNIAINALNDLMKRGKFITPYEVEQELDEFQKMNDPIAEWLNEFEEQSKDIHGMPVDSAFTDYKNFCSHNGYTRPLSKKGLTVELRNYGYYTDRGSVNGEQQRMYLKTDKTLIQDNSENKDLLHYNEWSITISDQTAKIREYQGF